ncbi:HAD-like domain-containing protein [Suillus subaureus]|uniref:HAD-like domain-containing protein n=1 Tax=Suillus subaureus TaxID=48587 RepID=A0A9P7E9G7_9AGAM|nr:HAD-like domain-containing protein [Suillus subaureus]KAG1814686.1 HAD-like domain-containing protein [Suillus subaureus]
MTSIEHLDLRKIDAGLFDVFGTVLDWHSTVARQLARLSKGLLLEGSQDAVDFAEEWRAGYCAHVKRASQVTISWDGIFASELFGSYKPNKKVYQSAAYHLSLPPHKIAMVATHKLDLIAASSVGFNTIYVPRPAEDSREVRESMRSKKDGGEVDLVVKDFEELARLIREARLGLALVRPRQLLATSLRPR